MRKIDFLIVGAQKAGTTSLYEYLSKHDEIFMPFLKELNYFSNDQNYAKGEGYYHDFFSGVQSSLILGEASPQYMYSPDIARRIFDYSPSIKLIMCLRDPADRAYSHFRMNKRRGKEINCFETIVLQQIMSYEETGVCHEDPEFDYLGLGLYGNKIKSFLRYFESSQIKVVWSDDLDGNRKKTVDDVIFFLGLNSKINPDTVEKKFHTGGEARFPRLYQLFVLGQKAPSPIKQLIKTVIGKDRLGGMLHRLDTQFFIDSKRDEMEVSIRAKLDDFYAKDAELISELVGVEAPWR